MKRERQNWMMARWFVQIKKKIVRDLLYYHKGGELLSKNTVSVIIRLIL
jgi:hypothetical protein